jgi:hypothetical protein
MPPLSSINRIFDRIAHGNVAARVVLDSRGVEAKYQRSG